MTYLFQNIDSAIEWTHNIHRSGGVPRMKNFFTLLEDMMTGKAFPPDVVEQAQAAFDAWNQIDPNFAVGDLHPAALQDDIAKVTPMISQANTLEAQLTDVRNRRDDLLADMWDKVKRVRNAVKGIYGDDSSQYEMIGGTRLSERKPRTRKQPVKA